MYSEVSWVLVSLGTQVWPQIILYLEYLSNYLFVSCDYEFTFLALVVCLSILHYVSFSKIIEQCIIFCYLKFWNFIEGQSHKVIFPMHKEWFFWKHSLKIFKILVKNLISCQQTTGDMESIVLSRKTFWKQRVGITKVSVWYGH